MDVNMCWISENFNYLRNLPIYCSFKAFYALITYFCVGLYSRIEVFIRNKWYKAGLMEFSVNQ